jgi:drug/metabolite transporter (DMT)-like permease
MISAIIGILLGLASYYMPLPFVPPIIGAGLGAALGVTAIIQERRGAVRNWKQVIAGIAAIVIGVLVAVLAGIPTR